MSINYKLIIKGDERSIESLKKLPIQGWNGYHPELGYRSVDVEFIIKEPTFRVKTLSELAAEFGGDIRLCGLDMIEICDTNGIAVCAAQINELGQSWSTIKNQWTPSEMWKALFLKEII